MKELPKVYDPKQVEKKIYDMWMRGGYFRPEVDAEDQGLVVTLFLSNPARGWSLPIC